MSADAPDTAEVRNVFEQHIPSIASGIVTIRGIARDRGNRSVLAVSSSDPATDPVGSCVGLRGATIKSIVKELRGEFVDIVRWSDSAKEFLGNLFTPMRFYNISFDETSRQVIAVLKADRS